MFSIIQAAGWPIIPLIICSIFAVAIIIERFMTLQRKKIVPKKILADARTMLQSNNVSPSVISSLEKHSPLGYVLAAAVRQKKSHPMATKQSLAAEMEVAGGVVAHQLEKWMNALGTIAAAAPLLGLLGTVIGMIEIFASNQASGANPQQLAQGISIALYNTAFGLMVAIPALIFWRYFRRKIDDYLVLLEQTSKHFLDENIR